MIVLTLVLTTAGVAFLALAAYEVYATVLHARGSSGPVAEALCRAVWRMARLSASRLPRTARHQSLNRIGPLLLPALLSVLVALFVTGFALIYLPWMPHHFKVDEAAEKTPSWLQALYFSGVTLTTLGYGDVVPRTMPMRFTALAEAGAGFVAIPLAVSYFLTVSGALERRRAAARALFHEAGHGPDAVPMLLARHHLDGRFVGLAAILADAARDLQGVLETHVEHPITHYFHPVNVHDGLPRILFLALEAAAVLRAFPDPETYPEACGHPALATLEETARHALIEVSATLRVRPPTAPLAALAGGGARLQGRVARTRARLTEAGIVLRPNRTAAGSLYHSHRLSWELELRRLSLFLGYDWDEVSGDRNPIVAAEADALADVP